LHEEEEEEEEDIGAGIAQWYSAGLRAG